ncbi:hypothetical protein INS49_015182 [Diaporthe citri]|uniref:uncharacterized protein n=1 Tax=Diaporthe citri TaxID=83186 RepID=UPI001C815447|nr:uncharacterized protein INS49_015182 [Diaporthe citri]KAG6357304.1 hypothetical protein INS49_015182 [Diaporthe citri]
MVDISASGELDVGRLRYNFANATQSEKETVIRNHLPPPDPRRRLRLGRSSIEKVDFVLEKREHWSAIRLQEYRRDEKALRLGPRRPLPSTRRDLPDLSGDSQPDTEEPGDQSPSATPPLIDFERSLEAAPGIPLRKDYRQHAKDVCVLVPFQEGKHGFAREVTDRVDVEVIRLWLSRCENRHNLCSQRISDSYPPGLILIDAVKMCLVPVASHNPVRYMALSYVWGYIAQPILTKAALEKWVSDGELKDVEIPQTIREAIMLVQMIGYRYIWVDALCIVQDDAASRHAQISQMHEIYRHADMTIVAAGGDNCSEGLPGVTLAKDRVYKHRRYELPGLCLMKAPSSTKHSVEMSPWRTRGWTFQEELCSRRTLVLLPEVMFFSCASAVWREDIQLEAEDTLPRSEEGLMSLASVLHQKNPGNNLDLLLLFRDLVKKYMQRTLSRTDDMENAFAGVAGILEPVVGPAYHGILERMFAEVIQGCWFWDTSLQRRAGFPSWSWTGWIYRREQADVGIQPLSTASDMSKMLAFYKIGPSGIQILGQSCLAGHRGGGFLPGMDVELRSHFIPNEDDIKSKNELLLNQGGFSGGLIAFHTSIAHLRLRTPPGDFVGSSREYRVFHPQTNQQITSIRLNVSYVAQKGTMLPFIVVDYDQERRSFRLMLISMEGNTVERVNVTSQGRLVKESDWKDASPKRELVFMS